MLILALITEVLRLINNLIESKSPEQRNAEMLIWFELSKPLYWDLLKPDTQKIIDQLTNRLK